MRTRAYRRWTASGTRSPRYAPRCARRRATASMTRQSPHPLPPALSFFQLRFAPPPRGTTATWHFLHVAPRPVHVADLRRFQPPLIARGRLALRSVRGASTLLIWKSPSSHGHHLPHMAGARRRVRRRRRARSRRAPRDDLVVLELAGAIADYAFNSDNKAQTHDLLVRYLNPHPTVAQP